VSGRSNTPRPPNPVNASQVPSLNRDGLNIYILVCRGWRVCDPRERQTVLSSQGLGRGGRLAGRLSVDAIDGKCKRPSSVDGETTSLRDGVRDKRGTTTAITKYNVKYISNAVQSGPNDPGEHNLDERFIATTFVISSRPGPRPSWRRTSQSPNTNQLT